MKHRNFALLSLIFSVTFFILIAIFNYVIDPYGYNNQFTFKEDAIKMTQNARQDKLDLLEKHSDATSFIFGSSRAMRLSPELVTKLTGDKTLNLAFHSASADEYYLYIKYLIETRTVKRIIIGIDLFAYTEGYKTDHKLPLKLLQHFNLNEESHSYSYFNFKTFRDSIHTVKVNLRSNVENDDTSTPYGQVVLKKYIESMKRPESFKLYVKEKVLTQAPRWDARSNNLSHTRLNMLKDIEHLCKEKNIELLLFTSPLWIKQITMKENKFENQKNLLRYIAKNIHPIFDFNAMTEANTDPYAFEDEFHYGYLLGNSVLNQMLTGTPIVNKYRGTLINASNIDDYLYSLSRISNT